MGCGLGKLADKKPGLDWILLIGWHFAPFTISDWEGSEGVSLTFSLVSAFGAAMICFLALGGDNGGSWFVMLNCPPVEWDVV